MRRLIFNALLAALLLSRAFDTSLQSAGVEAQESVQKKTLIVLLGTGTPNADPDRSGPSVAIVIGDTPYIIDFGPGVVRRAAAAFKKGVTGLKVDKLKTAFVTHLHSDHTVGYPDLIFTPWTLDRKEALEVYGPSGLKSMTNHILKAYKEDIYVRTNGLEPSNHTGYKVNAHEIKPGIIYKDQNVTVKAFRVNHGSWREAYGYRFETMDRTIVISGDCTESQSVIENCNGCDVLIHEVYSEAGLLTRPPEWQKYHRSFHTSSRAVGEIATKAKPGVLILYHQLLWGTTEEDLIKEVQQTYSGKIVSGHDLDIY